MKAMIFLADGFEDLEFFYPYYRFQEAGFEVDVAAPEPGRITSKHGYTFDAKRAIRDVKPAGYDLLILVGGKAPEQIRLETSALAFTKALLQGGKIVAAICHGPQVLISAGVLKGRKATSWKGIRDDLKAAGAAYEDRDVVVDGNLVTSRCPDDLPAFCREVMGLANLKPGT